MIPERLRLLRKSRRLSQNEVATEVHITRSTYSSYETGRRIPSLDVLIILSRFFNTSTDYLLGFTDDPERPPVLDGKTREIVRNFQAVDPRGQDMIYQFALQERIYYDGDKS